VSDDGRFASAMDKLTREEQIACRGDVIKYGSCFIFEREDGTAYRVPPVEFENGAAGWKVPDEPGKRWWS
jgi:hypothetical protein